MKIVLIQNDLPPDHFGGAEILTLNLAKNFYRRGVDVTILTRKLPKHNTISNVKGISVRRVGLPYKKDTRSNTYSILWAISYIIFGIITCIKIRPHIIHAQTRFPGGIVSGISGFLLKSSSFISVQSNLDNITNKFERLKLKIALKINQDIIVQTEFSQSQVMRFSLNRIHLIPNGIKFDNGLIESKKFSNNILFIGRLHPVKGLKYALKACKLLKDRKVQFKFSIVGSGSELAELNDIANTLDLRDHVEFVGTVDEEKKREIFRESSYFLLPSISECFPISILEAMKEKLYIIATKVGGVPEMLLHGKLGELTPSKNEMALADSIYKILKKNDAKKIEIINTAFEFAIKRYNLDIIGIDYIKSYIKSKN